MNTSLIESFQNDLVSHLSPVERELLASIQQRLGAAGLKMHTLQWRLKSISSLEKKLARPDRVYARLDQVTDILAFRLVTYTEDEIASVAKLIETSFEVDYENSENKLHGKEADRFGYRSLHYICVLPNDLKATLPVPFRGLRFEIQIRTALQHVWAEIEHAIGYKAAERLPEGFRRRFSQIASLLEVADREFTAIRTGLADYESQLKLAKSEEIELDELSLKAALGEAEIVALDQEIASVLGLECSTSKFYPDYILRSLRASGLTRVGDLLRAAQRFRSELRAFAPIYFDFARKHLGFDSSTMIRVDRGYALLFVAHLQVIRSEALLIDRLDHLTRFYQETDFSADPVRARQVARAWGEVLQSAGA